MIKNKKYLDTFMRKHWAGYLSDWQKDQWVDGKEIDRLSPAITEDVVYDFIWNVEDNKEVKDFYPLIWDSIDWKKLTKEAIRIAKKEYKEREVQP